MRYNILLKLNQQITRVKCFNLFNLNQSNLALKFLFRISEILFRKSFSNFTIKEDDIETVSQFTINRLQR